MPRILLIEDDEANRDLFRRRLRRRGFDVVEAEDGKRGVSAAQTELPDLILMDMNMPGMDGWEATRQIKALPETAHIPVIGFSAHQVDADRDRALAAGCVAFQSKSQSFGELVAKIETILKDRRA